MPEPKAGRGASGASRVAFIDQARSLAITMMIVGHSLDRFLAEPWRSSQAFDDYQFVRGITSALFLMVSGFSFVVASFKHWDEYTRWSPKLWGRVRRIALIYFLGYSLHMWAPTLFNAWTTWTPEYWVTFLQFDILQNIATGLLVLHAIVLLARDRGRFWIVTAVGWFLVIGIGLVTYRPEVDAMLPVEIAVAANMSHKSIFPLVPWMNFLFMGATFGYWFWQRMRKGDEWKVFAVGACGGAFLVGVEILIKVIPWKIYPYAIHKTITPGNIFARGGLALLAICLLWLVGRYRIVLAKLAFILSKDSLAIYFVHLVLVYGGPGFGGCFLSMRKSMDPAQTWAWIIWLFSSMALMAWAIGWMRKHRGVELALMRHITLGTFGACFLLAPYLTVGNFLVVLGISAWFFVGVNWLRRRLGEERAIMAPGGADPPGRPGTSRG